MVCPESILPIYLQCINGLFDIKSVKMVLEMTNHTYLKMLMNVNYMYFLSSFNFEDVAVSV